MQFHSMDCHLDCISKWWLYMTVPRCWMPQMLTSACKRQDKQFSVMFYILSVVGLRISFYKLSWWVEPGSNILDPNLISNWSGTAHPSWGRRTSTVCHQQAKSWLWLYGLRKEFQLWTSSRRGRQWTVSAVMKQQEIRMLVFVPWVCHRRNMSEVLVLYARQAMHKFAHHWGHHIIRTLLPHLCSSAYLIPSEFHLFGPSVFNMQSHHYMCDKALLA